MRKVIIILSIICTNLVAEYIDIDAIRVVIYSEESTDIITDSDIRRPSLEGSYRSKEDIILEKLIYADAKKLKILPDEDAIDRHLQTVQRENNLTLDQLKEIFKSSGYTYEDGKNQFAVMTTINSMLDFKIRSRLLIPEREIVAYYQEHPVIEQEMYLLERAVIPYADDRDAQRESIQKLIDEQHEDMLNWNEPLWYATDEIAQERIDIISTMNAGATVGPFETEQGYELLRLKEIKKERTKPLDERYAEISDVLRKPRFERLFNEYKDELFSHASIIELPTD